MAKKSDMLLIENKKASMKYRIIEEFSAGIELFGGEVKSLRGKHGSLDGSRIVVRGGEAYMVGATIPPYQAGTKMKEYDAERPRRLLLKKEEIRQIAESEAKKGLTSVPIEVYNNDYIKVRVAIVQGKTKVDHREDIKKKEANIDMERAMKRRGKA